MGAPTAGFSIGWLALGILLIYTVITHDGRPILAALIIMCMAIMISLLLFTTSRGGR